MQKPEMSKEQRILIARSAASQSSYHIRQLREELRGTFSVSRETDQAFLGLVTVLDLALAGIDEVEDAICSPW